MKYLKAASVVIAFLIGQFTSQAQEVARNVPPIRELSAATLACAIDKLSSLGGAPPQFATGEYRVKGFYGKFGDEGEPNGIHILAYGPKNAHATLYQTYLETHKAALSIFIGVWIPLKREKTELVADDLPGGIATQAWYLQLIKSLDQRDAFIIDRKEIKASKPRCTWTP
jgi:hypothetical protein